MAKKGKPFPEEGDRANVGRFVEGADKSKVNLLLLDHLVDLGGVLCLQVE